MTQHKADITHKEDLSIAVMNLISIEEHLAFTSMKTGKQDYLEVLKAVRKLRIELLKELLTNTEGELWCISKHLLGATMRLTECATKYLGKDNAKAQSYEEKAFDLYGLFWLLQKCGDEAKPEVRQEIKQEIKIEEIQHDKKS